jgi:hypothetical protein
LQTTSKRLADRKSNKFQKNVLKRGAVPETTAKKSNPYPVGPIVLGFFVFVVIGSGMVSAVRLSWLNDFVDTVTVLARSI